MTPRTLVFITIYPFNRDYAEKYGFALLRRRGYRLLLLNAFRALVGDEKKERRLGYDQLVPDVEGVEQARVRSLEELERRLREITGWRLAILAVAPRVPLLRALKRANVGYLQAFANTEPPIRTPAARRLLRGIGRLARDPAGFYQDSVLPRIPYGLLGIEHPRYVVRGSDAAPDSFPPSTRRILAHSFDYDRCLRGAQAPRHPQAPEGEYFVHLECPPWECHDLVVLGLKPVITKKEYEALITRFFDFVEKETGRKIVVSAHPKHTQEENVYGGRPFLYGTEPLVRHASGVFCHYSGAIKFAVMHRKPLCFITSRRLQADEYYRSNLSAYAAGLQARPHFIDHQEDWRALLDGGLFRDGIQAYDEYMRRYVVGAAGDSRPLWDIVADALEKDSAR